MGTEFHFCKMKNSGDLLHNVVSILDTTESVRWKMAKTAKFVFHHKF